MRRKSFVGDSWDGTWTISHSKPWSVTSAAGRSRSHTMSYLWSGSVNAGTIMSRSWGLSSNFSAPKTRKISTLNFLCDSWAFSWTMR
jgi:hypothetical protein